MNQEQKTELKDGVTLARLAEIAGTTTAIARTYDQVGLLEHETVEGKKRFHLAAFERLEQILVLNTEGLKFADILKRFGIDAKTAAQNMRAELETLQASLEISRAKIKAISEKLGSRAVQRVNELVLSKKELAELEQLRQSNIRRALLVEQKARAIKTQLEYKNASMSVTRIDLPQAPRKSKKRLN